MRYFLYLIVIFFIISCRLKADKPDEEPVRILTIQPSAHADSIRKVITDVETKNLQLAGLTILSLKINGMEVIRISLKDYYKDERNSQLTEFAKYMQYLDHFAKVKSPIATHSSRAESQAKHDAVIKYLDNLTNKTSGDDLVYKVVYYLNATTTSATFNQLKTTYLDQYFNKKTMDYSFLNSSKGVANE
jgi:hypothetical protein